MGSACCVAAKDRALPIRTRGSETLHRNVICSPSWSFRWENRRRVAGEIDNSSHQLSHGTRTESKREYGFESGNNYSGNFETPSQKSPSPVHEEIGSLSMMTPSDISVASNYSPEVKNSSDSPEITDTSAPKISYSISSVFSTPDPIPSRNHPILLPNSTPSRRARRSPGHHLSRQVSDSRLLGLKSPISEGRPSFVLSTGSFGGGSSDGWSMRTFSELVASSQRERWSFDSGKSSLFSCSPSIDTQTCGACSKLLSERTSWNGTELAVVAVLVCGHVYHAECLESMTLETDKYDPACPICAVGEKKVSKMSRRNNKISRNRVVDSYLDGGFDVFDRSKSSKVPKLESSSSSSRSKPFLKRHFSIGSKWSRSLSENDSARKGFWARYRKD